MEMNEDVFSFEDFLAGKVQKPVKSKPIERPIERPIEKVVESVTVEEETVEEVEDIKQPEPPQVVKPEFEESPEEEEEESYEETPEVVEENFYPLFKDKSENFSCDIYVEGAKTDETITRLIVETEDWTLMFPGEIKNGKVTIPIRKLNIFEEGQRGTIKLEVIAEGTLFVPYEQEFKIKVSKKVSVVVNENKKPTQPVKKPGVGVKVNVKR
jgi:hypothetical protein